MRTLKCFFIVMILTCFSMAAVQADTQSEDILLTTYYPAPYGEYDELSVRKMTIGADYPILSNECALVVNGWVGIGTESPEAILDVNSTTSAFLPPRVDNSAARDADIAPLEGMVIYNKETKNIEFYDGTDWVSFGAGPGLEPDFDSDWFDVTKKSHYTVSANQDTYYSRIEVLFSPDSSYSIISHQTYPIEDYVALSWQSSIIVTQLDSNTIKIKTLGKVGVAVELDGTLRNYDNGYYRVLAWE